MTELVLVRHGETEWSRTLRHTGRTDVPLTAAGREQALLAGRRLADLPIDAVLVSPLGRARETCELAGLLERADTVPDLMEVDYGDYEGRTTLEVRETRTGWDFWHHGVPGGETHEQVAARADRAIDRACAAGDLVALFAHGHILRILTARWLGLEPRWGGALHLGTAAICRLGHERERRVILGWNDTAHLDVARGAPQRDRA